jgi:hypothetical protein
MEPAIIGLVGVLVGAVITTGANYLIAVRHESAEQRKESRARKLELKRAARLIENDFTLFAAWLMMVKTDQRMMSAPWQAPGEEWQKRKEALASELTAEEWTLVTVGAVAMEQMRLHLKPEDVLGRDLNATIEGVLLTTEAARKALRRYL